MQCLTLPEKQQEIINLLKQGYMGKFTVATERLDWVYGVRSLSKSIHHCLMFKEGNTHYHQVRYSDILALYKKNLITILLGNDESQFKLKEA
jgi:hypothetical protein